MLPLWYVYGFSVSVHETSVLLCTRGALLGTRGALLGTRGALLGTRDGKELSTNTLQKVEKKVLNC